MEIVTEALDERHVRVPVDAHHSDVVHPVTGRKLYTEFGAHSNYVDDSGKLRRAQRDVTVEQEDGHTVAVARSARYVTRFSDQAWPVEWKRREDGKVFRARPMFATAFDERTPAAVRGGQLAEVDPATWRLNTSTRELEGAFGIEGIRVRFHLAHGGPGARHRLYKSLLQLSDARYYGTVWEVSDPEAIEMLMAGNGDSEVRFWTDGRWVVEYVRRDAWDTEDGSALLPWVEHDYTTVGGALTADEVWTGTVHVTSTVTTGAYNLTLDAQDGPVVIKVAVGVVNTIQIGSTGNLVTSDTSNGRRVYWTSENDDSIGETISGSTGVPAPRDYTRVLLNDAGVVNQVNLSYVTIRYGEIAANGGLFQWQVTAAKSATLDHISVYNCEATPGATLEGRIISTLFNATMLSVVADNIYVDASNSRGTHVNGWGAFGISGTTNVVLTNSYFAIDNTGGALANTHGVRLGALSASSAGTYVVTNVIIHGTVEYGFRFEYGGGTASTYTAKRCVSKGAVAAHHFFIKGRGSGSTVNATLDNCIAFSDSGTANGYANGQDADTTITLNKCVDWAVGARTSGPVTDNDPKTVDPIFGNLPAGVEIAPGFAIVDGFAIGNQLQLRYEATTTYDGESLDPKLWTATGYRDLPFDEMTIGAYYLTTGAALPTGGPEDEGDVLIEQTEDDGEITIENGLVTMTPGLDNAAYLSLFGGNEDDPAGDDRTLEWWGNMIETDPAREYRSETQHLLRAIPAITANLRRIEDAARRDLAWMIPAGVASTVEVAATMPTLNKVQITVTINGDETLEYTENWAASV